MWSSSFGASWCLGIDAPKLWSSAEVLRAALARFEAESKVVSVVLAERLQGAQLLDQRWWPAGSTAHAWQLREGSGGLHSAFRKCSVRVVRSPNEKLVQHTAVDCANEGLCRDAIQVGGVWEALPVQSLWREAHCTTTGSLDVEASEISQLPLPLQGQDNGVHELASAVPSLTRVLEASDTLLGEQGWAHVGDVLVACKVDERLQPILRDDGGNTLDP